MYLLPVSPPCGPATVTVYTTVDNLDSTELERKSAKVVPMTEPFMVDPSGRFIVVSVAVSWAEPRNMLLPLR